MEIFSGDSDFSPFLNAVACNKSTLDDWRFVHVKMPQEDNIAISYGEIEQFLVFHFQDSDGHLLKMPETGELLMFSHKKMRWL